MGWGPCKPPLWALGAAYGLFPITIHPPFPRFGNGDRRTRFELDCLSSTPDIDLEPGFGPVATLSVG